MKAVIVGCGRVGAGLADALDRAGWQVLIIDKSPSAFDRLPSTFAGTALRVVHYEDITPHYAETLRRWRETFFDRRDAIKSLGMDERFFRTWDYYLAYCEGAFHERVNLAAQLVFENAGLRRGAILGAIDG